GDGACLAGDAFVGVEDVGDLPLGRRGVVGILHVAVELPVEAFSHDRVPLDASVCMRIQARLAKPPWMNFRRVGFSYVGRRPWAARRHRPWPLKPPGSARVILTIA